MQMQLSKAATGWHAKSIIELGGNRVLTLTTARSEQFRASLVTKALVGTRDAHQNLRCVAPSDDYMGDFAEAVLVTAPLRLTEKVVRRQQARALATLDAILLRIEQHYARAVEEGAADA